MTRTRRRIARLVGAVVFTLPVVLGSLTISSLAAPSAEEVEAANEKLSRLRHEFEELAEQYNDAKYRLALTERKLADARASRDAAEAKAEAAEARLSERAVEAYLGTGSQVDGLLGADSIAEFSDRLEFMGAVAESDAELALDARNARQEADWAADRYRDAAEERRRQVEVIDGQLDRADEMIAEQAALADELEQDREDYLDALAAQRAALEQARIQAASPPPPPADTNFSPPPVNGSAAAIAANAARSVIGTQYVWGAADPDVGFDCSGLTSWAWAQAGVSIPHSSAAQYSALPHVSLSDVQPGDLIFYFSPISHVAIYVGGGTIVHARHPGPGGEVQASSMYGYSTPVGAARPG